MNNVQSFLRLIRNPFKFRFFLLSRLPAAWFSRIRLYAIDEQTAVVTVPYGWFSKNPFKSTYFACLAMAAEMSTGLLAMMQAAGRQPAVSMLVIGMEATYFKKATGITFFTCSNGNDLREAVEKAVTTGEAQSFRALSTGVNQQGEKIADFHITWSFKQKSKPAG